MSKEEMICKNCKYHYIEEISFDYPQSCCSKRMATTEEWCKCNDFEYGNRYIELLQQENKQLKDNWNKLKEYIRKNIIYDDVGMKILDSSPLEDYIQELEQGSDSNEI